MYFVNNKIFFSNKEKNSSLFRKKLPFNSIEKTRSLWKKVKKKRLQQLRKNSLARKNLFFTDHKPLAESQLKETLLAFIPQYNAENFIHILYQRYIQNNKINEHAYLHFYNRLSAKIDILKIIDTDKGKNIALNPNIVAKTISILTYSAGLVSSAIFHAIGAVTRHGINEISDMRKIKSAKNKLNHWITDLNFIKFISIMLTKILEPDFARQEKIDYFLDTQFLVFWNLFKKQAKIDTEIPDLNDFWSTCLVEYIKELKCFLLKDNFERCLNEMFVSLKLPYRGMSTLIEKNQPNISKDSSAPSQENILLAQLILQVITNHYVTWLLEFNQRVKIELNSSICASTFWSNRNNNSYDGYPPSPAIPTFSPELLITCH
jgi:hypothetical protein